MKSTIKFLLFTVIVFVFTSNVFSQVPNYVPTNGLVGYWPFNGNANDESGNGNNGLTGSGVALTTDRFLISNSAYDFNGSGNISLTSLPTMGSQDFSISGWIKTNNLTLRKGIACWGQDSPWNSSYFYITDNGYLKFDFAYNGGPQSPIFVADNNWHSVLVTCTSGLIQLYLDGAATGTALTMTPNISGSNKSIGANIDNSGSNNFIGVLDDIGIWNRALTQQEITNLYTSTIPVSCLPAYVPSSGLVGYWPFCGNANDESGNGNNGTVNGATLTSDRNGNINSAFSFDGVSNFIEIPSSSSLQVNSAYTISAWVFIDYQNYHFIDQHSIISKINDGDWYGGYELRINGLSNINNVGAFATTGNIGGVNIGIGTPNVVTGQWYFVTVTYDSSVLKIYLNNIEVGNTLISGDLQTSNNKLRFGRRGEGNSYNCWYKGKMDDIGIWNRALTPQEITNLYTSTVPVTCLPAYVPTSGLVGYWPFCGNANDESGNGNNGTLIGSPALTSDRFGNTNSSYNFNGTTNYISLPIGFTTGSASKSFSVWFYLTNGTYNFVLDGGTSVNGSSFGLFWNTNPTINKLTFHGDGTTYDYEFTDINFNQWYHTVITYDGTTVKSYLNGVYIGSKIVTLNTSTTSNIKVGCRNNTSAYFVGKIDDIGVWDRTLVQQEITNLYTSTVPPTAAVLSGDATICAGASTNLSVAVTGGTAPYTVTVTDGTNNYSATGASPVSIPVSPTSTSTYSIVSVTGGGTGTGNTGTAIVTVIDATISASDSVICAGETVTLSVPQGGYSNTACAALPTNLQTGLVGYWPFCGNANDESGNGNNGTVNGATLTTDRFGNANGAYSFDGSGNQNIAVSGVTMESEFTLSLWYQTSNYSSTINPSLCYFGLEGFGTNFTRTIDVTIDNVNYPQPFLRANLNYDFGFAGTYNSPVNWTNITVKLSNSILYFYIDNVLIQSTPVSKQALKLLASDVSRIGCANMANGTASGYFNGKIDDVAIWNRALTSSEIQQLYTLGQSTYLWSTGATTATLNVSPTATTTYTCTTTINGVSCTDSVTVIVNNPIINLGSDVTACGTSTTLTAPPGYDSYLWSNGATTNTTTVSANGTYSCTVSQGLCSASDSIDVTLIDATISASDSVICAGESVTLSVPQGGSSNTACASLPTNLQTGLVGYWPFCGNANDESGNGNNGNLENGVQISTDRFSNANSAYDFDGNDDRITVPHSASISPQNFVTVSTWIYPRAYENGKFVLAKGSHVNLYYRSFEILAPDPNQKVEFRLCNGSQELGVFSSSSIPLYQWTNITCVYNGNQIRMYVNGVLENTQAISGGINQNTEPLTFGGHIYYDYSDYWFDGKVDDVAIFNRVLSQQEILDLYNQNSNSYAWSTGATTPTISDSPTTTTTYTCTTTTNGVSCTDSVTVVVNNPTIDLGSDVTACGTSTTLTAPTGYDSYLWSNGATTNTTTVSANGTYSCTVKQGLCSATDSIVVVLVPLTTNTTPISACDSYLWNGTTYTASGIYSGTTTNCVTESLNLTITPSSTNTTPISACDSYSWNGTTYTSSGVYTGTTANCVTQSLNLTITPSSINTTPISACDSYSWNGTTYTATGVYTGTTANCVTQSLNLTITPSSTNTTPISACDSYSWNGTTYTATGVYTGTTANCVTQSLNLTITPSSTNTTPISACNSYVWNGTSYTASGVYTGTTTNCVTESLNLTITPSSTNTTPISACDSYSWNGTTYTSSGVYTGTTANCVTESLNLTITPSSINTTPISACDSYSWNGTTYTATGVYTGTTANCVTQSLNLTITPSSTNTTPISACNSYVWNGTSYTSSGVYSGTTTNCVTESLNLTITPSSTNTTPISACDSYSWNGTTYTASGVYTGTTTNCVTQSLNLTITPSSTNTTPISACDSYSWNGTTYTSSGVYTGTTTNCVTESLNLTITPSSINTTPISACDSYSWNGTTYTASGAYTGTTANCVTQSLNLTITPSSTNTTPISACDSYSWNGTTYTASGAYTGTTTNCVTESLNLTITPSSTYTISVSACGTYTWPNNGQTYTTSGIYTGTTANCVTQSLNLTITPNTSDTTTINANDTYTWAANGITYTASGIYTGPTSANCVTQYLNLTINSSGISEEELVLFSLYPNPVSDMLYVNLNGQDKQDYLIIDNFGAVIKRGVLGNLINEISVSQLSSGLYYFKIEGTKPRKFSKID